MARPDRRDPQLEAHWRECLAHWKRSGQTIRAFCAAHGLSENSFYYKRPAKPVLLG